MTHPSVIDGYTKDKYSYIATAYVQNIEAMGARTIPIFYDYNYTQLKSVFKGLNGLFFPGGAADIEITVNGTYTLSQVGKTA